MEFKVLKKPKENPNVSARKEKRTLSPPGCGDEVTPHKKMKYPEIFANISHDRNSAESLTSPESCEKRTEYPSTSRVRPKSAGKTGAGGHANAILDLQVRLQKNYNMLIEKMEPTEFADKLHEKGILDTKALEKIKKGSDRRVRNDILLKNLCRIKHGNRENVGYDMFISLLNETGQGNLVKELETIQRRNEALDLPLLNDPHDVHAFVDEMKETLLEEVEPRMFLDDIVGSGGLSMKEHEDINTKPKRRLRIETLLEKVKSAKDRVALKIIRHLTVAYPDLYTKFESGRKGNRPKQQKEAEEQKYSVPVGSPLQMKFQMTAGHISAVQDTNEHTDPVSEMIKKERQIKEYERRIASNSNEDANKEQLEQNLEICICEFKQIKFSCIKIILKSLSKESLRKLVAYSRSGGAKKLLLSLIDEETKQKLLDMNAQVVLEISHGCEDGVVAATFEKECMCHLKKETVTHNFTILMEGMRGSRSIINRFLQSRVIDDRTRLSLNEIRAEKRIEERNRRLLQFLLDQDLPDVFFCILEDEIVKHDGTDIIHSTIKNTNLTDYEVLTRADILHNSYLLKEELEARWFVDRLGEKPDRGADDLVKILLTSGSRDQRITPFLQYLLRQNDLSWFSEELKIRNKHLFDIMVSRKASNKSLFGDFGRIQAATHLFFDDIIEEVDPLLFTKRLGKKTQKELRSSKLEDIPKRSDRASKFCLSLLGVSASTLYDALNMMTSCGYKDIVDNITALAREDAGLSSASAGRGMKILTAFDDTDYSNTYDDFKVIQNETIHPSSTEVDKLRHDDFPPIRIKISRKSRVQSVKGESESGIFSGSGTRTGFNTDEDSDYEDRRSKVDKRKMTTEWIVSHSKSESFGIPFTPPYMHIDETRSHLPEGKLKDHGSCVL